MIYPKECIKCRSMKFTDEIPLCRRCFSMLKNVSSNVCKVCGRPVEDGVKRCDKCIDDGFSFDYCASSFYYDEITSSLVKKFKYQNRIDIGLFMSGFMCETFISKNEYENTDYFSYIPFNYLKKYNRYYNHSMLLAGWLSEMTGIPVIEGLIEQNLINIPQAKLGRVLREKRPNMFHEGKKHLECKKIVLIDDVITTGRTLSDAAFIIKKHNEIDEVAGLTFAC